MSVLRIKHIWKVFVSFLTSIPVRIVHARMLHMDLRQRWESIPAFRFSRRGRIYIGKNLHTRSNVVLRADGGQIMIGRDVFMNHNVCITSMARVQIGNGAAIANNVVIVDHDHDYRSGDAKRFVCEDVVIGDRVWIGANCTILKGTRIGNDSVIAAGSTVKGVIPENCVYYQQNTPVCRLAIRPKKDI